MSPRHGRRPPPRRALPQLTLTCPTCRAVNRRHATASQCKLLELPHEPPCCGSCGKPFYATRPPVTLELERCEICGGPKLACECCTTAERSPHERDDAANYFGEGQRPR